MIIKYILELEIKYLISPIEFVLNENFQKTLGVKRVRILKIYLNFTSCLLFILSIIVYNVTMNTYKN